MRLPYFVGQVGLFYVSDYGYATSGGTNTSRTTCLNTAISSWDDYEECPTNDWLFTSNYQWSLNIYSSATLLTTNSALVLTNTGWLRYSVVTNTTPQVKPVVFLKNDTLFISENGSITNPYELILMS